LIPFKPHPVITEASRPLKAFEYLACGLPVVSVPIATLQPYGDLFCFASTPQQFAAGVLAAGAVAFDEREVGRRVEAARREDYDARFGELLTMLEATVSAVPATTATPHADHTSPGADRPAVAKSGWTQMLPEPLLRGLDLVPGRVQRWAAAGRSRWLLRRRPRGT
jgi:hypothetical protein